MSDALQPKSSGSVAVVPRISPWYSDEECLAEADEMNRDQIVEENQEVSEEQLMGDILAAHVFLHQFDITVEKPKVQSNKIQKIEDFDIRKLKQTFKEARDGKQEEKVSQSVATRAHKFPKETA